MESYYLRNGEVPLVCCDNTNPNNRVSISKVWEQPRSYGTYVEIYSVVPRRDDHHRLLIIKNPNFPYSGLVLLCSRKHNEDRNFRRASYHDRVFHFHVVHDDSFLRSHKMLGLGKYEVRQSEALHLCCDLGIFVCREVSIVVVTSRLSLVHVAEGCLDGEWKLKSGGARRIYIFWGFIEFKSVSPHF